MKNKILSISVNYSKAASVSPRLRGSSSPARPILRIQRLGECFNASVRHNIKMAGIAFISIIPFLLNDSIPIQQSKIKIPK
jgi:hypothetical protein